MGEIRRENITINLIINWKSEIKDHNYEFNLL